MRRVYAGLMMMMCMIVGGSMFCGNAFAQLPFGAEIHAGAGYTFPQGEFGRRFDGRGHFIAGGGFKILPFTELQAEYMFNTFGINRPTLARLGEPNGDAHVQSITVNPVLHLPVPGRFGVYGTAGIGYYHRTIQFTQPVLVNTFFFDPFFGFFPVTVGANQVIRAAAVTPLAITLERDLPIS